MLADKSQTWHTSEQLALCSLHRHQQETLADYMNDLILLADGSHSSEVGTCWLRGEAGSDQELSM